MLIRSRTQVSDSPEHAEPGETSLLCAKCSSTVGWVDSQTRACNLRKLQLSISSHSDKPSRAYDSSKWLTCLLLCAVESEGMRKFTVSGGHDERGTAIKTWVFTPDLTVSTSVRSSTEPVRVTKVLWKKADPTDIVDDRLNTKALSEGQLQLRKDEFTMLKDALEGGSEILPKAMKQFQDWHVALLERFTANDLASFYCSF